LIFRVGCPRFLAALIETGAAYTEYQPAETTS
jgi:hypothetical protein